MKQPAPKASPVAAGRFKELAKRLLVPKEQRTTRQAAEKKAAKR